MRQSEVLQMLRESALIIDVRKTTTHVLEQEETIIFSLSTNVCTMREELHGTTVRSFVGILWVTIDVMRE